MFKKLKIAQASFGLLLVIIVIWVFSEEQEVAPMRKAEAPILSVSTIETKPEVFRTKESVVGIAQPRWPMEVVSTVEGRVVYLNSDTEPGKFVSHQTMLVSVDDTAYRANVAASEAQIRQAELELAKFQHEQKVVDQISVRNTTSEFGRFVPHIKASHTSLIAAREAKIQAENRLKETRFYPPFDAIVLEKRVVPGQWVSQGEVLFTLIASDSIDIDFELSTLQLDRLGNLESMAKATVIDQNGIAWRAYPRYMIPSQSPQTKQRQLVFYVENTFDAASPLLPNSIVNISIVGKDIEHVVSAPNSVVTPDGFVWIVEDNRLAKVDIVIVQEVDNTVWFTFENPSDNRKTLVLFPLNTMLEGQRVNPDPSGVGAQI